MPLLKVFAVWLAMMATETVHGTLRTLFLAPLIGDFRARQIAVFTGALLLLGIACLSIRWLAIRERRTVLGVGVLWVALTLAFEIELGRVVLDAPWSRILADYDLAHGGLMPLGLLVLGLSPWIAARLRRIPLSS